MNIIKYFKSCFQLYTTNEKSYEYIEKKVDWLEAYIFAIVIGLITSIVNMTIDTIVKQQESALIIVSLIGGILGSLLAVLITPFISFGILHLFFMLFGTKSSFQSTLKTGLSLTIPSYIMTLPFLISFSLISNKIILLISSIILFIWSIYMFIVNIFAYSYSTKMSKLRVLAAMIIPIIIVLLIMLILGIIIAMFTISGM